jgi:hypothetical protein
MAARACRVEPNALVIAALATLFHRTVTRSPPRALLIDRVEHR